MRVSFLYDRVGLVFRLLIVNDSYHHGCESIVRRPEPLSCAPCGA